MALSQRHRSTIYTRLEPLLGEEETEALLAQFPAREIDEPVTREFVHAEIEGLRSEMNERFGTLHAGMNDRFGTLHAEMNDRFGTLHAEMNERFGTLHAEMNERFGTLRAEMHDHLRSQTVWFAGSMMAGLGLAATLARLIG